MKNAMLLLLLFFCRLSSERETLGTVSSSAKLKYSLFHKIQPTFPPRYQIVYSLIYDDTSPDRWRVMNVPVIILFSGFKRGFGRWD